MRKLQLSMNGETIEVLAQKIAGRVWFHYEGQTHEYQPQSSQSQGAGASGVEDPSEIKAPMPGKIIKVFVKENQKVVEGETVVAMEAMKMEYNLKATQDMMVSQINCQEGEAVGLGDILVRLEEVDG